MDSYESLLLILIIDGERGSKEEQEGRVERGVEKPESGPEYIVNI